MIHIQGKIPITIHPAFWLFAGLVGFLNSMSLIGTVVWMGIILVSVLFHEFGHALSASAFGQKPRIELVALGGLTYHDGVKLPFWKQFLIVLAGPVFGFLLFILATVLLNTMQIKEGQWAAILMTLQGVNLFWTILNLIPIMPLDGGQLMRILLEAFFGLKGFKYSLFVSMFVAVALSLFFFLNSAFLIGALLFLLAFQSYETWRRTRFLTEEDRRENIKAAMEKAESALQEGREQEALEGFEKIRKEAKEGMMHNLATQYLAYLKYQRGEVKESYDLLRSIRPHLSSDALCLLHRAAFDQKDYSLVVELAGICFQTWPTAETALRNAYASAFLSQARPTVGWLQAAVNEGVQNIHEILSEGCFDSVKHDPYFQDFLFTLKNR